MSEEREAKLSKVKVFARRLGSSVFLYGVLMVGLFGRNETLSHAAFGLVITLLGVLALLEYFNMADKRNLAPFKSLGIGIGVGLILATFWLLAIRGVKVDLAVSFEFSVLLCLVPTIGIFQLFAPKSKSSMAPMASTLFGVVYVALLLNVVQIIRYYNAEGHWWLMYFIVVSKMSDTGAYCVGSLIGEHKMIPRVSPGKTWEGFVGGVAFSVMASWAFFQFGPEHFQKMGVAWALGLGVALGVGSVLGDLIESLMKREADVKDSGSFFPGIGGILDLLDSLLFNAPIMYLYLRYGLPQ
jgi:phosphatidate cytidylyltransferase